MTKASAPTAYRALVLQLSDAFDADYDHPISADELPALSDDQISVVILHDPSAFETDRIHDYAQILNSAVHVTHEERVNALGVYLREALNREAREYLRHDVNAALYSRMDAHDSREAMPATEGRHELPVELAAL